jgi:predicted dienelactone hydrolase
VRIAAAVLFVVGSALLASCSDSPAPTSGVGAVRFSTIGLHTTTFVDESRPTAPHNNLPGLPNRTLATDVWYPAVASAPGAGEAIDCLGAARDGATGCSVEREAALDPSGAPYPLIVLSHGFGNGKEAVAFFAKPLAEHGYVVVAPTFPLSGEDTPGGPFAGDLVPQAGDVSFLIDVFLGEVPAQPAPFPGMIDATRLGTGGRSLGGSTTLVVADNVKYVDTRLRAAAAISPSLQVDVGILGADGFFAGPEPPLLIVGGSEDTLAPFEPNQQASYDLAPPPKILVELIGEGHVPEVEATNRALVAFFDAYLRGRTSALSEFDELPGARVERDL